MVNKLLYTVTIPKYPRFVELSKSRRIKPYIRSKSKIPKKVEERIGIDYQWKQFTAKGGRVMHRLIDIDTGEVVPSNPKAAGTPRLLKITGNSIYSCMLHHANRDKIIQQIQNYFMKYVDLCIRRPITEFPLIVDGELYDTFDDVYDKSHRDWDVDNRAYFYNKAFMDVLTGIKVTEKGRPTTTKGRVVIPDDHRTIVTGPPRLLFVPIDNEEERKIVYNIYKDERDVIKQNKYYNTGSI